MTAKFGTFNKAKNSTKKPASTWGTSYNVVLKEDTSLYKPILKMKTNAVYNYCLWRGRYYFINDIVYINNECTEYHLVEDVLATWEVELKLSNQYVVRNANRYDSLLIDELNYALATTSSTTVTLSSLDNQVNSPLDNGKGFWIVGTIGSSTSDSGCVNYYVLTAASFRALMSYAFNVLNYGISSSEVSYGLQKILANPMQYVVSACWYPFGRTPAGASNYVNLGFLVTQTPGFLVDPTDRNMQFSSGAVELPLHPQRTTHGFYLCNSAPYTQYLLNVYQFGTIPLNPMDFPFNDDGKKICYITIRCDMFTGKGQLFVANYSGELIYQGAADMGVPAILSNITQQGSGLSGILGSVTTFTQAGLSALSSSLGDTPGYSTADMVKDSLGISSASRKTGGVLSAINSVGLKCGFSGSQGSSIAYNFAPRICATFLKVADVDSSVQGRPLCKTVDLGDLHGYTQTKNTYLDFACSPAEHDAIVSYMEGGFFLE